MFTSRLSAVLIDSQSIHSSGTPQLLSLSGIGPKGVLSDLGIDVIVDAPAVGANLVDHPLVANYFTVNSNNTWDPILRNSTLFADVLENWETERQGLFVDTPGNTQGYFKLPKYPGGVDPSAGPLSANTEVIFAVSYMKGSDYVLTFY